MPFAPGTPKPPNSGRKKGVRNKLNLQAAEVLASLHCNPLEGMARIATDSRTSKELRGRMYAELAHYVYPTRKAMEVSGPGGDAIPIKRIIGVADAEI